MLIGLNIFFYQLVESIKGYLNISSDPATFIQVQVTHFSCLKFLKIVRVNLLLQQNFSISMLLSNSQSKMRVRESDLRNLTVISDK